MNFASDNWAGAHDAISENLARKAGGFHPAYGNGPLDKEVEKQVAALFEHDVSVFFVATGTAANSLALAAAAKPGGITFCHPGSHVYDDECGAPEFFAAGRLRPIAGREGRMDTDLLEQAISYFGRDHVHTGQPAAVSITQASELGTVYAPDAVAEIADIAHTAGLPVHMDGSRFANAVAALDVTPAELSWKSGVDMLSFGGTKNGCWCAEALIVFKPELAAQLQFHRKRAGHLLSKSRFVSAQFEAYLADGLWLDLARHANARARELAEIVGAAPDMRLLWQQQTNELFPVVTSERFRQLADGGLIAAPWDPPAEHAAEIAGDETMFRMVTSFATTDADIAAFAALAAPGKARAG